MMILQIDDPTIAHKLEQLARLTGRTEAASIECAIDQALRVAQASQEAMATLQTLLGQFDRLPEQPDTHNPLRWDAQGLPQ